jgi:predicted Rossmann fold flavoprotein
MKVGIIGGGACGLMLATILEKNKIDYTIFNSGKIGRKILASGNGRCNISNINYDDTFYHNNPLSYIVKDNQNELFDYFNELKIYTFKDEEGRMYPISESSLSVLNILLKNIKKDILDIEVKNINKINNKYYINNEYEFDYVVCATGSYASYIKNKRDEYNRYLNDLNITISNLYPSLVGFKVLENVKTISGVRSKAYVKLVQNDCIIHSEHGEVNFKDDGISGICIMNLSSYYANLSNKDNCQIVIDLAYKEEYDDYSSILNPKLLEYVLKNNINPHSFTLKIKDVYDFEFAQVSHGGIDTNLVNKDLSYVNDKNIYFGGELLNIDGVCGGYNLMFAFTSALVIARSLKDEILNRKH